MAARKKRTSGDPSYAMPGLLNMSDIKKLNLMDGISDDDSDDDGDLEAELAAIVSGKGVSPRKPKKSREPVDLDMVQKMATECMKSDDESEIDENISGDEELMAELDSVISAPRVPFPTRRPAPAIPQHTPSNQSTLTDNQLSNITPSSIKDEEDVPPPVIIPSPRPQQQSAVQLNSSEENSVPTTPSTADPAKTTPPPKPAIERQISSSRRISMKEVKAENTNIMLTTRRDQYKAAALNAKKSGDLQSAMNYVKIAKQFDTVIDALAKGQPIDLSKMPPPPPKTLLISSPPLKIQPKPVTVIPVKSTETSQADASVAKSENPTDIQLNLEQFVGN